MNEDILDDWKKTVGAAVAAAARIAVCGIGNDLRGDDGAGLLCLRKMQTHSPGKTPGGSGGGRPVLFVEGGETPENETGRMRKFQPDLVLLIDAARAGQRPGEIFLIKKEMIPDEEVSTHRISLSILIRYLEESLGARVVFIGIEPLSTAVKAPVSDRVRKSVSLLADYLRGCLRPFCPL